MSVQPKLPAKMGGSSTGSMSGKGAPEKFDKPLNEITPNISDMHGVKNDIGEKSGFEADVSAYIDKKGTPYGEAAKFNVMPPGMNIDVQPDADIRDLPYKEVTSLSYPGDGWE